MRYAVVAFALASTSFHSFAQEQGFTCRSNDPVVLQRMEAEHPGFTARAMEAKAQLAAHDPGILRGGGGPLIIPVVFHIIHNNGPENISDAQVYDAVRVLNDDFNRQNADWTNVRPEFLDLVANVGIEFRLAQLDPEGNCTNGITRTVSTQTNNGDFEMTQLIQWPRNSYMNIWVAASASGAAGYTYYPIWLDGWPEADGIVLLHSYVGSIGTSSVSHSRVLSHEVGHWLNLMHCWGDSNEPGTPDNCFQDDEVTDTPLTSGWTACVLSGASCGSALDNVENYMEYSYCAKMFSRGQAERMIQALTSPIAERDQLWQTANLQQTGVLGTPTLCAAQFTANLREVCAGSPVVFNDLSFNGVQQRAWTFPGGQPATSDASQPTVTYASPGVYPVSLVVSDGINSLEVEATNYITVLANPGAAVPVMEGFENMSALPSADWGTQDPDGDGTFTLTDAAAYTGIHSTRLLNGPANWSHVDALVSNTYDLSDAEDITITFRYAYAKRAPSNEDVLRVYVSNNCGVTWSLRQSLRASNINTNVLTTGGIVNGTFVPTAPDQWGYSTVNNISTAYHTSNFRLKFEFESGGGNALYLDDINISGMPVGMDQLVNSGSELLLIPNPATGHSVLVWQPMNSGLYQVELVDSLGRIVQQKTVVGQAGIRERSTIELNGVPAGMYSVVVRGNNGQMSTRLAVE
ncbi:MAG: PKD domain-containing protein [Flavobacteriales bacterium]|nr:PKD domain-containing protein [Flavobacteriales bacterium]